VIVEGEEEFCGTLRESNIVPLNKIIDREKYISLVLERESFIVD